MNSLTAKYMAALSKKMADVATASCERPNADPFEHGRQVGEYKGLQEALKLLEDTINESNV